MSILRVKHGETFNLSGTLTASQTLIGLTGDPGAQIDVAGTATNQGTIELYGARLPHKQGATLIDTGMLTNSGLIDVGGGSNSAHAALLSIAGSLTNFATAEIFAAPGSNGTGGRIEITGKLHNSGTLMLGAGTLTGDAGASLADVGVLVNDARGTIILGGFNGPNTFPEQSGTGASATISGTFINDGALLLQDGYHDYAANAAAIFVVAGTMTDAGYVMVGSYFGSSSTGAQLSIAGILTNTGTISAGSGAFSFGGRFAGGTIAVTGAFDNEGLVTLRAGGNGGHYVYGGASGLLLDSGTVTNSGTLLLQATYGSGYATEPFNFFGSAVIVDGVLTNTGVIMEEYNSGLLVAGSLTNSGTITAGGGSSFQYNQFYEGTGAVISVIGGLTNAGTVALGGGLSYAFEYGYPDGPLAGAGANMDVPGTLVNSGKITVGGGAGGYLSRYGITYGEYLYGTGAQLVLNGSRYASGITNFGTIDILHGLSSSYGVSGTGGTLVDASRLMNEGLITLEGGSQVAAGRIRILSTGAVYNYGTINGSGILLNQGAILLDRGSIAGVTFINDGMVQANGYRTTEIIAVAVAADPGRIGSIQIDVANTLQLGSAVAASQTVVFQGNLAALNLVDPAAFAGTLSGITATDLIDFSNLAVTAASSTGDILAITTSSGTTLDLALAAPLSGLSLTLQSDGHNGTDLLFSAPPPNS